jgi:hypothetical protein
VKAIRTPRFGGLRIILNNGIILYISFYYLFIIYSIHKGFIYVLLALSYTLYSTAFR